MLEDGTSLPELLAPVGEWDVLVAAVQNGADAVYLGGKAFNARQSAANFSAEEMQRALDYAHLRGVRVYVTVNTLIKDAELEDALKYLVDLHRMGADAVILQDLGLARLARAVLPDLALHASTQMTVHNAGGVRQLGEMGFRRVVVARELSLTELGEITRQGVAIEAFVHGALCVCYSGQCLMSSLIGGRSGNRGRCAQPCRLEYALVDADGRELSEVARVGPHLLSPKDLQAIDLLPRLVEAGVSALKIEGRMKRPEYVATVVRVYRAALDRLAEGPAVFSVGEREHEELEQAFTRGFSTGYLTGNLGLDLMSYQRPSNRGTFLGRVTAYDRMRKAASVLLEAPLRHGDGLEFWVSRGGRVGVTSGHDGSPGERIVFEVQGQIQPGDRVFKTSDAELLAKAGTSYKSTRELKAIPLTLRLQIAQGQAARLELEDREGHTGVAVGEFLAEPARTHPLDEEAVRSRMDRLGNTPFAVDRWELTIEPGLMVPWSELNDLRRRALTELEATRLSAYRPTLDDVGLSQAEVSVNVAAAMRALDAPVDGRTPTGRRPKLVVAVGDADSLREAIAAGADRVIVERQAFPDLAQVVGECHASGTEVYVAFPRILRAGELLVAEGALEELAALGPDARPNGVVVGNLGLLATLIRQREAGLAWQADTPLNIFNRATLLFLSSVGASSVALSPELTLAEAGQLAAVGTPIEATVHGAITMMVSEYCAVGALAGGRTSTNACSRPCRTGRFGLRDRLGLVFPIVTDSSCRMNILNPKELCVIENITEFRRAGIGSLRIEARSRDAGYVRETVSAYRTILDDPEADVSLLKARLATLSPQGFTRGHYFRGVE